MAERQLPKLHTTVADRFQRFAARAAVPGGSSSRQHQTVAGMCRPISLQARMSSCAAHMDDLRKSLTNFINDNTPVVAGTEEVDTQPTLGFQRVTQRAMIHV